MDMSRNKNLVRQLRSYVKQYASGSTLGRAIVDTEVVMSEAAEMLELAAAQIETLRAQNNMRIETASGEALYGRMKDMLAEAINWAASVSDDVLHDLVRAIGIDSDELVRLGFENDAYQKLHDWANEE